MIKKLKSDIETFLNEALADSSFFIVDVKVSGKLDRVEVLMDGDQGISLDDCAKYSRSLGDYLEEYENLEAFQLYVSSPGIDRSLSNPRQYSSRLGRMFKLKLTDGSILKGKLIEISDQELVLESQENKKKKKQEEHIRVNRNEIDQAKVLVSFR